jgi:hypothetical protein
MERWLFIVRPTPVVVVPAVIVRLWKEVKKEAGSVFVVVSSTVPEPGVQVPTVTIRKLPQVKIPPLVISILTGCPKMSPIVTRPETVRWEFKLKINTSGLTGLKGLLWKLMQAALAISTVIVFPPEIWAISPDPTPCTL